MMSSVSTEFQSEVVTDVVITLTAYGTIKFIPKPIPIGKELFAMSGDLLQFISAFGPLSLNKCLDLCQQSLYLVSELHSQGLVHGSICPENICLTTKSLAILNAGLHGVIQRRATRVPLLPCVIYRPSDAVDDETYTPSRSNDMYSLTVLFYTFFSGQKPYSSIPSHQRVIKVSKRGHLDLIRPPLMPLALWNAVITFWSSEPGDRQSAFQKLEAVLYDPSLRTAT